METCGWVLYSPCITHSLLILVQSGNTGTDQETGQPIIFDPASYYGHNEAECVPLTYRKLEFLTNHSLAIARIFGGIPAIFFTTYHKYMPKTAPVEQYDLRGDLYELYHYLNHTVLFGVRKFNEQWCPYRPVGFVTGRIC